MKLEQAVQVISSVIISHGRLLLVRKKGVYIPPGGKIMQGESDEECLRREIREELSRTEIENVRFYREIQGISPHEQKPISVRLYFADIKGNLGNPSGEIESSDWISFSRIPRCDLSPATKNMVELLNKDGHYS